MANMGLAELILVEPATELGVLGHAFAKGAEHVLAGLRRVASLAEAVAPFQRVVGTTSARDRSSERPILRPRELPQVLAAMPAGRIALVFGPEVSGLDNDELALCEPLVNVACDPVQPTLNLAQSVLVLAYELFVDRLDRGEASAATAANVAGAAAEPARWGDVEAMFQQAVELMHRVRFARDDTFDTVRRELRQLAGRARLSEREVVLLRGVCRRVEYQLDRLDELRGETAPRSRSSS